MNSTHLLLFEILIIFHTLSRDSNHVSDDPTFDTELFRVSNTVISPLLARVIFLGVLETKSGLVLKNNDYLKK